MDLSRARAKSLPPAVEQRASRRATVEAEVDLHTETNFFTGFTEDLSDGGLFVATYQLLPVGTELVLSFTLPDGHTVKANGRVVWLREVRDGGLCPGMGVGFQTLAPVDIAAIHDFLRERPPDFYDV